MRERELCVCLYIYTLKYMSNVPSTHHRSVTNCFLGGPRNSSFVLCSRIHTTSPIIRKKAAVTPHIDGENGRKNVQALEFSFKTGTTTTSPDSIYG